MNSTWKNLVCKTSDWLNRNHFALVVVLALAHVLLAGIHARGSGPNATLA
jgi:hypothetical protein